MDECNLFLVGILVGITFILAVSVMAGLTPTETLKQKCAETQGRYDFCVQKIDWEVKN